MSASARVVCFCFASASCLWSRPVQRCSSHHCSESASCLWSRPVQSCSSHHCSEALMSHHDLKRSALIFPLPLPFDACSCALSCCAIRRLLRASSYIFRASISLLMAPLLGFHGEDATASTQLCSAAPLASHDEDATASTQTCSEAPRIPIELNECFLQARFDSSVYCALNPGGDKASRHLRTCVAIAASVRKNGISWNGGMSVHLSL